MNVLLPKDSLYISSKVSIEAEVGLITALTTTLIKVNKILSLLQYLIGPLLPVKQEQHENISLKKVIICGYKKKLL